VLLVEAIDQPRPTYLPFILNAGAPLLDLGLDPAEARIGDVVSLTMSD
jgi:hypothetical protein